MTMLDRGRLLHIGRPIPDPRALVCLDLRTLQLRTLHVPLPTTGFPPSEKVMTVDQPLWYDPDDGTAGILMRRNASVADVAEVLLWNLTTNTITGSLPLAPGQPGIWNSVNPIGYDSVRREAYLELMRPRPGGKGSQLPCQPGGPFDVSILAVTDRLRTIATFATDRKFVTHGPVWDAARHRSMHMEYAECGNEHTVGRIVDLTTGEVKELDFPRVTYGFAFDPDGRSGYAYSAQTGELLALDLATNRRRASTRVGRFGYQLDWVSPRQLVLVQDSRIRFLDTRTLATTAEIRPADFHRGSLHLEGSFVLPGRLVVRVYRDLYVLDLPEFAAR